jgi:hypothetical protein
MVFYVLDLNFWPSINKLPFGDRNIVVLKDIHNLFTATPAHRPTFQHLPFERRGN